MRGIVSSSNRTGGVASSATMKHVRCCAANPLGLIRSTHWIAIEFQIVGFSYSIVAACRSTWATAARAPGTIVLMRGSHLRT